MSMRVLPVGDDALLVELASGSEAQALHAELLRRRAQGLLAAREIVPAARTVLLDGVADPARLARELLASDVPPAPAQEGDVVEIPVRYDGPDLAGVAAHWGSRSGRWRGSTPVTSSGSPSAASRPASATSPACRRATTCRAARLRAPPCRPARWRSPGPTRACTRAPPPAAGS